MIECGFDLMRRMQSEKSPRMDTGELKVLLYKKVGTERFKKYFYFLNRLINQKLSKSDFDKSCYRIIGRENLPLHNQIIRAILRNACSAKVPPPRVHDVGPAKIVSAGGRSLTIPQDGLGQAKILGHNQSSVATVWSNGGVLPISPRKIRSGMRDRKLKDRPSPLCPSGAKTIENRDFNQDKDRGNATAIQDGEKVEHASRLKFSQNPLLAPLGIPFCSASSGGPRKALPVTHIGDYVTFFDNVGLYDSETLRRRMEQIAVVHGLGGVTLECANTLNNALDVYLKRLIKSCVQLVGPRSTSYTSRSCVQKQQIHDNGVWPSNNLYMQSGGLVEDQRVRNPISLLDFKTAMELDPQQLGEEWPVLLEKISMQTFEE